MKVYIVIRSEWFGDIITDIFANEKDANDMLSSLQSTNHYIEEHEVIE